MNQNSNIVPINRVNAKFLSDYEKIVYAYHNFQSNNSEEALKLLNLISPWYYQNQFHKDISRALLCASVAKTTNDLLMSKESEFYIVIYRLTMYITEHKIHFNGSGNFYQLKYELFKGLTETWP